MKNIFTDMELKVIKKYNSPEKVQEFLLKEIEYDDKDTIYSFRKVVKDKKAHCLEGALTAATILEQYGYPPLILDFHSPDGLDHVLYLYKKDGKYGAIGKSRCPRRMERKPRYKTVEDLISTYYKPYMDRPNARIKSYAIVDLRKLKVNWRTSEKNLWAVNNYLLKIRHKKFSPK